MYYLTINYGTENWVLKKYDTLKEIEDFISTGETYGSEFKVLKELSFKIEDN